MLCRDNEKDTYAKILSLDEQRTKRAIELAVGKWGFGWVFNVLGDLCDDAILNTSSLTDIQRGRLETRALLLREGLKPLFQCDVIDE